MNIAKDNKDYTLAKADATDNSNEFLRKIDIRHAEKKSNNSYSKQKQKKNVELTITTAHLRNLVAVIMEN